MNLTEENISEILNSALDALNETDPQKQKSPETILRAFAQLYNKIQGDQDTKRLDKLQKLSTGYGNGWILRESMRNRGMRLLETSRRGSLEGPYKDVRRAIDKFNT